MKNQAPFLDVSSFVLEEVNQDPLETLVPLSTPFLSLYESEEGGGLIDPVTEEYAVFLNELYDEEFNEALDELVSEAAALMESQFLQEQEGGYEVERILEHHFEPLTRETQAMITALASELGQREVSGLTDSEIEEIVDRYQPSGELSPPFEDFFGKLKKAFKKVAKKATSLAKKGLSAAAKLGLGPVLNKLKPIVRKLLDRVLQKAIGKLPASLQPIARDLAKRIGILKEVEEDASVESWGAPTPDVAEIQLEFIDHTANVLFAPTALEMDLEVAEAQSGAQGPFTYPLSDLDRAREQLVEELGQLKEGEDPTPYVENFIPALLPALRLGIRLAGRKRVVNFLAKFLARLVRKFVDPRNAAVLSRAIVDAGLRLINLEATPEDESRAVRAAVAETIEDTVRMVSVLPDHVLDTEDQELLEAFALEAFEKAAAANLPAVLPEEAYRKRPELLEARRMRGVWLRKPRRRYKKFSKVLRAKITPHIASAIETFAGETLEDFIQDQLGIAPGDEVDANVHLYESTEGTLLSHMARLEGFGSQEPQVQLHPLTPQIAGLLFEEPGLGREVDSRYLVSPHTVEAGQRFYYLEVPGKRPLTTPGPGGRARIRRRTRVKLHMDFPKDEIRVYLFLSEVRAQGIAVRLREGAHIGTITASLNKVLERGLRSALRGGFGRLKIVHETVVPGKGIEALGRLPSLVPQVLLGRLQEWIVKALAIYFKGQPQQFIKATEDAADGVTLLITIGSPPGFAQLREALKGKAPSLAGLRFSGGTPKVSIKTAPGYSDE